VHNFTMQLVCTITTGFQKFHNSALTYLAEITHRLYEWVDRQQQHQWNRCEGKLSPQIWYGAIDLYRIRTGFVLTLNQRVHGQ